VSLSGSLRDLPLLEILQVVSYTQRSGYLTIAAPQGDAGVVFDTGRIASTYVWDVPSLSPGASHLPGHEALVRRRIATALERLVHLPEGEFAFHLTEAVPIRLGGRDLSAETLSPGLDPEELMLDLARQLDESRRNVVAALEASAGTAELDDVITELPGEETGGFLAEGTRVLVVDDEDDVLHAIGDSLRAAGYEVREASSIDIARRELQRLAAEGDPFLVVVDLGLPSATGNTFRGGLDVLRLARGLRPAPSVVLMAERLDAGTRGRARRLGVRQFALKPGLSKLDRRQYEADLRAFGHALVADLLPRLGSTGGPAPEVGSPALAGPVDDARDSVLRSAIEEIEASPDPDLVSFLLLRAARSFFPRVILFVVKDESLHGLCGFGPLDSGDSLDLLARELTVTLTEPSPFAEAVAHGRAWEGPLPSGGPLRALLDRIGPLGAAFAAVVPVIAGREAIAVLYGDAPGGGPLPPVHPFVAFVERTGRALAGAHRGGGAAEHASP
jgi:CheY-like chemotaxis protein